MHCDPSEVLQAAEDVLDEMAALVPFDVAQGLELHSQAEEGLITWGLIDVLTPDPNLVVGSFTRKPCRRIRAMSKIETWLGAPVDRGEDAASIAPRRRTDAAGQSEKAA